MKNCHKKKFNNKGFTILELIIVIGIIIILAATALVIFNPAQKQKEQRDALRVSAISQIASTMELYYAENKKYPNSLSELSALNVKISLNDPSQNSFCNYEYFVNANNSYYEIYAVKESDNFTVPSGQEFIKIIDISQMNPSLNFSGCDINNPSEIVKVFTVTGGNP